MSQININVDNVAGMMPTVSNMMRQISSVTNQLESHMAGINSSIKSQDNIYFRMSHVYFELNEAYNKLNGLYGLMSSAINGYSSAENKVDNWAKSLKDIYGRTGGGNPWDGIFNAAQNFVQHGIDQVNHVIADAQNTINAVGKWLDENKEYIGKLLLDSAVFVLSVAVLVCAPEAAPLVFAADAYLMVKNGTQLISDGKALADNMEANEALSQGNMQKYNDKKAEAEHDAKENYMKDAFKSVGSVSAGLFGGAGEVVFYGGSFESGYNAGSQVGEKIGDFAYDGVDTAANVISLKGNVNAVAETVSEGSKVESVLNEVKKPIEELDTTVKSIGKGSKFSKFISSWGKKAEEIVGTENIKGIKDTKELVENYKREFDVGANIAHGMQKPATLNEEAKKSVSDIPIFGELGEDMIDLFENLTEK